MGSWGVTAHESDCGLDMLWAVQDKYLRENGFTQFEIKAVMELLHRFITDRYPKESIGWEQEYIDFFNEYTFPLDYAHAVMLVAECFSEYRKLGKLRIHDGKADKLWFISKFVYTHDDLAMLLAELQKILDSEHPLYEAWKGGNSLGEWQAHMQMLCDTLTQAMIEASTAEGVTE